jgi:hypothetical protein
MLTTSGAVLLRNGSMSVCVELWVDKRPVACHTCLTVSPNSDLTPSSGYQVIKRRNGLGPVDGRSCKRPHNLQSSGGTDEAPID